MVRFYKIIPFAIQQSKYTVSPPLTIHPCMKISDLTRPISIKIPFVYKFRKSFPETPQIDFWNVFIGRLCIELPFVSIFFI